MKKEKKNKDIELKSKNISIYLLVLFLVPIVVFWQSTGNGFVWDDTGLYLNKTNYPEQNRLQNLDKFWFSGNQTMYAPVTYTVWGFISTISKEDNSNELGANPKIFHIANILIHILNGILIFLILSLLLKNNFASIAGALVFALHPVQVEAVAWVSELRGLFTAFFGFISLYYYLKYRLINENDKKQNKYNSKIYPLLIFVFFLLSILSKPSGVVFPLIFLVFDIFYFKINYKKSLIFVSLFLPFIVLISFISNSIETAESLKTAVPFFQKPIIFLDSIGFYLYKTFVPFNFVPVYGRTPEMILKSPIIYLTMLVPVVIISLLIYFRKKTNIYILLFLLFVAGFIPVSGLVNFLYQSFSTQADRYLYISMFAVAFLGGLMFLKFKNKTLSIALYTVILIFFSFQDIKQIPIWNNEFSLWNHSIENGIYPSKTAYIARAEQYHNLGKLDETINDYNIILRINPNEYETLTNRGVVYAEKGDYEKAIRDFKQALIINPSDNKALSNLNAAKIKMSEIK